MEVIMSNKLFDFEELEKELPPIVFRKWARWRDVIPYAPRTVANEDSRGTGPKERIQCGRVVGYPRKALIEWLKERTKILQGV